MERNLKSLSNQFPVGSSKKKAVSYTLYYGGIRISDASYAPWIVCSNVKESMIKVGLHQRDKFKIEPNY